MTHFERFIDPTFEYKFENGPDIVRTETQARHNGLNCVTLAHLAIKETFDYTLPSHLHCYEMFCDNIHFSTVHTITDMQPNDIVWFGRKNPKIRSEVFKPIYNKDGYLLNWRDSPVTHVAINSGVYDDTSDPLLLHATHIEGTNTLWPLRKFGDYPRYARIYRIGRFIRHTF